MQLRDVRQRQRSFLAPWIDVAVTVAATLPSAEAPPPSTLAADPAVTVHPVQILWERAVGPPQRDLHQARVHQLQAVEEPLDLRVAAVHVGRIERDFELADAATITRVCFAPFDGDSLTGLDKLAGIVNATVQDAVAGWDGSLRVELSNGMVLRVAPDEGYEPWTPAGPGSVLVSVPGGGLG